MPELQINIVCQKIKLLLHSVVYFKAYFRLLSQNLGFYGVFLLGRL